MISLDEYAHGLVQRVATDSESSGTSTHDAFAELVLQQLEVAGHVDEPMVAYFRARGVQASGYGFDQVRGTLDLFVVDFKESSDIGKLSPSQLETLAARGLGYLERARTGLAEQVLDDIEAHDMAISIADRLASGVESIRVVVITNSSCSARVLPATTDSAGVQVIREVWDINRLYRLETSGTTHEPITVRFDPPLPCLATPETDDNYSVLLAIVPGRALADVYSQYGARLLELNVRSFLQLRGSVNKGIRETLLMAPERFLAYNNGISATASDVEIDTSIQGASVLTKATDFQIVNGGQTTASLHNTLFKDDSDLDNVYVQMKLTVVQPEHIDEIVPEISKYSNTQNKVTTVDFSSNHPFHVELEKSTRNLWAPALPGTGQETKWFYERARGQYDDALSRERTPARRKSFKTIHPLRQKFTKTDVAKWEHSWDQRPWLVSLGAEKNFRAFMAELGQSAPTKDGAYVKRLIAKGILFKATERIVTQQSFGGYRANIVTYTIAKLSHATAQRVDLESLWDRQELTPSLSASIEEICLLVQPIVMDPRGTTNISEWAKRESLWGLVQQAKWEPSLTLASEFLPVGASSRADGAKQKAGATKSELANIETVSAVGHEGWFALSRWAAQTGNLESWQRSIAYSIGKRLRAGGEATVKQAKQGVVILAEAQRLGFDQQA